MTLLSQQHLSQAIELNRFERSDEIDATEIAHAIGLAQDALRDAEHIEMILTGGAQAL